MDIWPVELLWRGAIAVIPIAILVAVICRFAPCKASTRHMLWLIVLLLFAAVPVLQSVPIPEYSSITHSLKEYFSTPGELQEIVSPTNEIAKAKLPTIQQSNDVFAPDKSYESEKIKLPSNETFLSASSKELEPLTNNPVIDREVRKKVEKDETKDYSQVQVVATQNMPDQNQAPGDPQMGAPFLPAIAPTSLKPESPGVGWSTSDLSEKPITTITSPQEEAAAATIPPVAFSTIAPKVVDAAKHSMFDAAKEQINRWSAYLSDIRNAIMGLPPLPAFIWIGGALILLLLTATKVAKSNRLIKYSRLAPPSVVNMVASASEQLELKRAPLTLITDQPISPMIWCGRQVYLILPRELWTQLNDVGRKAVIYHELAHLHRRDHWVCWLEMVIGWLYWWNPVVWWVRRRLREEADLCCDAWVTVLMPSSRRAYAQALLDSRKCTSISQIAGPSMGLGVSTKRAKRFARRLTMVMTEHAAPRVSLRGLTLALALAVGGCIVTPLWACPPSEKASKQKEANAGRWLKELTILTDAPQVDVRDDDHGTTFEKFMQSRSSGPAKQRIERLQQQIKELKKELSRIHRAPRADHATTVPEAPHARSLMGGLRPPTTQAHDLEHDAPHAKSRMGGLRPPKAPKATTAPRTPKAPKGPRASGIVVAPKVHIGGQYAPSATVIAQGGPGRYSLVAPQSDANGVVARKYKLSGGKLKALTELMVRQDVPIIVSPHDEYIEVHANHAQHMIFSAFTKMIGSSDKHAEEYQLSDGKLKALIKLMSRDDVPIIIEPDDDEITVHGNALEQAIFDAFVKMISQAKKISQASSPDSPFGIAVAPNGEWREIAGQLQGLKGLPESEWAVIADELRGQLGELQILEEGQWAEIADQMRQHADKAFSENSGNWEAAAKRYQAQAEKQYRGQMKKWADAAKIYELQAGKLYQGDLKKILGSLEGQITFSTDQATKMALEAMKVAKMAEMLEAEAESLVEEALEEIDEDEDSHKGNNQRRSIERMIEKLMKQIEALKTEAQAIEAEADVIEEEAQLLQERADHVENALAELKQIEKEIVASNAR